MGFHSALPTARVLLSRGLFRPTTSYALPHSIPTSSLLRTPLRTKSILQQFRTLIAAPKANQGPLLERRSDRALPNIRASRRTLLISLPIFLLALGISSLLIFNYQKTHSSVVSSTLYALRTHPLAREILGDEIQFRDKLPWIRGDLDQFHGRIDIEYDVKGTKDSGVMRFRSTRRSRLGLFETETWELRLRDGRVLELLGTVAGAEPFPKEAQVAEEKRVPRK